MSFMMMIIELKLIKWFGRIHTVFNNKDWSMYMYMYIYNSILCQVFDICQWKFSIKLPSVLLEYIYKDLAAHLFFIFFLFVGVDDELR